MTGRVRAGFRDSTDNYRQFLKMQSLHCPVLPPGSFFTGVFTVEPVEFSGAGVFGSGWKIL